MQEWSLIKGQYNRYMLYVHAPKQTETGEKNLESLENCTFPRVNVCSESAGTPGSPSSSVASDHPALTSLVLCFRSFGSLLQPFTLSSTHFLSAHTSSASPSETPNPFILYLSADEVVKLPFIPLPCPPLSLPFDGGSKSLYFAVIF